MARFLHVVAYAQVAARNTKLVSQSFLSGGDEVDVGNAEKIRAQADVLAGLYMSRFSSLCKSGSNAQVKAYLNNQRSLYVTARRQVDAVFHEVRRSSTKLQKELGVAADVTHILHGAANATFGVLAFFATAGGGLILAKALNFIDSLITAGTKPPSSSQRNSAPPPVIPQPAREITVAVLDRARDEALDHVSEKYADKAANTLTNIVTREWKYQGALNNAQARFETQAGVAVGAKSLSVFFAVKGILENVEEIKQAVERLREADDKEPVEVEPTPDIDLPVPL
ncbi:MAG TPA: hypothetical protein VE998_04340 [Terriglobales bacterium]|nr:hypothetical protein [Terriglobales bacterium]